MDDAVDTIYQPDTTFKEDKKDPLIALELTDSTELWLIQWPDKQAPDFNGQHVSLKLQGDDEHIGVCKSSSGISYELRSMNSQGPQKTVFLNSTSEAKIAGKISRYVSLIHYPEPRELAKRSILHLSQSRSASMASSTMSGRRLATPTRSSKPGNSSGYSTPSSITKSTVTGLGKPSQSSKRKRVDDESRSVHHSSQDSEKPNSGVISTGSMEQSQERKSKKKSKTEN